MVVLTEALQPLSMLPQAEELECKLTVTGCALNILYNTNPLFIPLVHVILLLHETKVQLEPRDMTDDKMGEGGYVQW